MIENGAVFDCEVAGSRAAKRSQGPESFGWMHATMPRYHFDLVDSKTAAHHDGQGLPDYTMAEHIAEQLAATLRKVEPTLRNRNFAILVTNQDSERICRVPLDPVH